MDSIDAMRCDAMLCYAMQEKMGVGVGDDIGSVVRVKLVHVNREQTFDMAAEAPLADFASAHELQAGVAFVGVCGRLRSGQLCYVPHACFLPSGGFVFPPMRELALVEPRGA